KDVYREKTTPVDTFKPNALGLFDMHGNVQQWCGDYMSQYDLTKRTDPTGPADVARLLQRSVRGGAWMDDGSWLRAATRNGGDPRSRYDGIGFGVVMVVEARPGEGKGPVPP